MARTVIGGHADSVLCCEVQACGQKLLASGGEDGAICLTDLSTLELAGRIVQTAGDAVPSLCWHPGGGQEHTLFAAAGCAVLHLDLRRGLDASALCYSYGVSQDEVNSVAVSAANGGWLAAGDDSGEVQIISLQPQQQEQAQQQQQQEQQSQQQQAAPPSAPPAPAAASSATAGATPAATGACSTTRPASYKTLRRGHSNICSAVAFRQHRPWELLSGGLDATVVRWDFSRLRPLHTWSLNSEATASGGQLFNPPMVHSLAVPQTDERGICNVMAIGRGDGCISLYDADHKAGPTSTSGSGSGRGSSSKKVSGSNKKQTSKPKTASGQKATLGTVNGRLAVLGREQGGHSASVNCVSFRQGSAWQQLLSAGNDSRLLLWNWKVAQEAAQAAAEAAAEATEAAEEAEGAGTVTESSLRQEGIEQQEQHAAADGEDAHGSAAVPLLAAEHQHSRKINWVCSTDLIGCPHNVFLADTGRRLTALTLA